LPRGRADRPVIRSFFFLLIFFFLAAPAFGLPHWLEGLFLEGGAQYYFAPGLLQDHIQPEPGFRGGLGYEWRRFRFSAEAGFTRVAGTNPLVLDIALYPVIFKAGYTFPLIWGFGLKPELGLGPLFSRTGHYPTVMDLLLENKRDSETWSFFSAFRLDLTYTFPGNFIGLYAGGGVDMIVETGGPIPLPVLEAGLTLKPFALAARIRRVTEQRKAEEEDLLFILRR
jgi:hypothetical protein